MILVLRGQKSQMSSRRCWFCGGMQDPEINRVARLMEPVQLLEYLARGMTFSDDLQASHVARAAAPGLSCGNTSSVFGEVIWTVQLKDEFR